MTVRKIATGKWLCECYPGGRTGRRIRKQFATKSEIFSQKSGAKVQPLSRLIWNRTI